ncbi:4a-hydroxytetrahydrobiopterin dehydratase [Flavobacterium commune]|uniref:Putative pterin-4-alpha-carbinolamine dehydratase n=1 Tax=Flavobacterium commune TaxID=1306519 RepID=A0A1D9PAZ3_9FLAO|nr:4a-hydroxytetrahydrobiopterin dehydratase [Flavobacterium commune]AOZ99746.1 4a-hydroxytetrahydrobiopterin dehydratase [Flavobacterium commune]
MEVYNENTAQSMLSELTNWTFVNNGIEKKFQFKNFNQALAFIVQVGLLAETKNHHPELYNVYNKVNIRLSTHDANGVTDKDFDLAKAIEKLF